jgi:hypothetical protein
MCKYRNQFETGQNAFIHNNLTFLHITTNAEKGDNSIDVRIISVLSNI